MGAGSSWGEILNETEVSKGSNNRQGGSSRCHACGGYWFGSDCLLQVSAGVQAVWLRGS